jgi:FKBP-type peptidyl-prolyl cis-trans isomerase FklB
MVMAGGLRAAEEPVPSTQKEKISYTLGRTVGKNIKNQGIEIDIRFLQAAIRDVLEDKESRLTPRQMQEAISTYQQQKATERKALADKNKKAGEEFLAANKSKQGVKVTDSGLQYSVLKAGKGASPKPTDTVVVNYRGMLINGKEFDSSYKKGKPATFPVNRVIRGWQEALPLMQVGAKWKIFVPAKLAYGERGARPSIGPNETLVFEIELLEIKEPKKS